MWFYLALSSVSFFTVLNLLQRKLSVNSESPRAMAFVFDFIALLMSLVIFFASGAHRNFVIPTATAAWISLLFACLMYGFYERFRFTVAKNLDASVFSVILNLSVLVAFVGSSILYKEPITVQKLLGAALIVFALVLVSYKKRKVSESVSAKSYLLAVAISVILGFGWMMDKMGALYFTADTYNILVWGVPILFIYFPYIKTSEIKKELKIGSWKIFVLSFLNVAGYLLQLKAIELHEATRVIPIVQTSTLFTVLLGIVLLNEKEHLVRKSIAGAIAIIGVFLLM